MRSRAMLGFGCSITKPEVYARFAEPGIELAREPDSEVYAVPSSGALHAVYNEIVRRAAAEPHLEGLALLHQDLEITDPEFAAKVRRRFRDDPEIAVIGIAGGRGVHGLAWWDCDQLLGCWEWRSEDSDVGMLDKRSFDNYLDGSDTGCHEVDAVDGMLLVLSPWATRTLRFDEGFGSPAHGYDVDICFQARAHGKKVVVDELHATHHHSVRVMSEHEDWVEAFVRFQRKWEGRLPGVGINRNGQSWEEVARRAVGEMHAARMLRNELSVIRNVADRRFAEQYHRAWELEQELKRIRAARTWRYTEPLRRTIALVRRMRSLIQRNGLVNRPKRFS